MKSARLVLIVLLVTGALASCAKRDTSPPANSGEPTTTTSTTEAATATTEPPAKAAAITLKATEYAYSADGLTVPSGPVQVTVENDGMEEHQATIVRFKEGKSLGDLAAIAASDPAKLDTVIDTFGGPNSVAPDGTVTTTQSLEPGDYVFMCFIPAPDGQPHAAKGMAAPFTVEAPAGDELAEAANTLELKEYEFGTGDDPIKAGTYTVTNAGTQIHEAAIYAPAEGKTIDDVLAAIQSETPPTGELPYVSAGGLAATDPGTSVQIDLTAGDYVFICFLPDTSDGAPHFTKGMVKTVTVED